MVEVGVVEEDVAVYIVGGRLLCLLWKEVVDVVEFELDGREATRAARVARAERATEGGARIENEKKRE